MNTLLEGDQMTDLLQDQKAELHRLLLERECVLRAEIREGLLRSGEERYKDIAGMVSDAGDQSVADMLTDIEISAIDRDVRELREVEGALERITRSDFGACVDCGALIDYRRLKANPTALRCHACQSRREHDYAHQGTPSL